jgi:hypothetical protein
MKKIICIYLIFAMVLTGCGKVKHLIGGSDKLIENNDKNSVGIIPSDPTPSPTPTDGKDENEKAEQIRDTQVNCLRTFAIAGLVIFDLACLGMCVYWCPAAMPTMAELFTVARGCIEVVGLEYLGIKSADFIYSLRTKKNKKSVFILGS